jgi:hypothetical protein
MKESCEFEFGEMSSRCVAVLGPPKQPMCITLVLRKHKKGFVCAFAKNHTPQQLSLNQQLSPSSNLSQLLCNSFIQTLFQKRK